MKREVCIVLLTVLAVAARTIDFGFDKFIEDHGHDWKKGTKEYAIRKEIFEKEVVRLFKHNAAGHSWKEGINKFSAMSPEEKKVFHP